MIYSFINLVTWKYFYLREKKPRKNKKYFIDSTSLLLFLKFYNPKHIKQSGLAFYKDLLKRIETTEVIHVGNFTNTRKNKSLFLTIPFWNTIEDISLDNETSEKIAPYNHVVIGITSPKQEILADQIIERFPDKHIYCLGAAVYLNQKKKKNILPNWVKFLIQDRKRTFKKLKITIQNSAILLISSKERNNLKDFSKRFDTN